MGCGYWGPNLIRNFSALPQCLVRYVCDKDEKRLAHMKQLYPQVETTTEFEKIVGDKEVDAVVVATPVHLHYELAKKSLEAGKHAFVEKPMTQTSEQGNDLVQLAAKKKLTLMVGHTFLYSAPVRRIKEIVESGDIGEIQYISSRRLNLGLFQKDINVAWDLAPHDISIILHLLGKPPVSVNCQGKAHVNKDIEDVTNMSLNFDNGGFATIHSSWLDPNKVREMTIVGSKRMIVYDDNEPLEKIKIYDKRVEAPPALRHLRGVPVLVPLRRHVRPVHQAGRAAQGGVPALPGLHPDREDARDERAGRVAGHPDPRGVLPLPEKRRREGRDRPDPRRRPGPGLKGGRDEDRSLPRCRRSPRT